MILQDALKECEAVKYGDFTLASGKKSKVYIDIKKASTSPKILKLIAKEIAQKIKIIDDYIGCVAVGGISIATAVSLEVGIPLVIVRKETKDYGTKGQIIGDIVKGRSVMLIEDVTTTGGSVIKAIEILRKEGLVVNSVISVVDREEGADFALEKIGVKLIPLVKMSDLIE